MSQRVGDFEREGIAHLPAEFPGRVVRRVLRGLNRRIIWGTKVVPEIKLGWVAIRVYRLDDISSDVVLRMTVDPTCNAAAIIEQCAGGPGYVAARCVSVCEAAVQPADARAIGERRVIWAVAVKVVFVERLGALGSASVEGLLLERQVADVNVGVSRVIDAIVEGHIIGVRAPDQRSGSACAKTVLINLVLVVVLAIAEGLF